MDALEALGERGADAEQRRALRRPVARGAAAVHLAGHHHQGRARGLVAHGRVEQRRHLARGEVARPAALLSLGQLVLQLHVRERAAHHHLVVAAPGTIRVEVGRRHAALLQVAGRGRVGGDGACGRDVVGGDEVAQQRQRAGAHDGIGSRGFAPHAVEVRRATHVGGRIVPGERITRLASQRSPRRVAVVQAPRALLVQIAVDVALHERGDLLVARPDVGEVHRGAVRARAQHVVLEVDVHRARQRVGDDRGRGG